MGDLDHKEEPDAITEGRKVALEILDTQRQRSREDLVEGLVGLALRGSRVRPIPSSKTRAASFLVQHDRSNSTSA